MSNSKKRNTFLILSEYELLAATVQRYPCFYDKNHRSHKGKNVVQSAWEAVTKKSGFAENVKSFFCHFRCIY